MSSTEAERVAYRFLIPTNQLAILAQLDPSLRVMHIEGRGSVSAPPREEEFQFGRILAKTVGNVILDWTYDSSTGPIPIRRILEACREKLIPDASITKLMYWKRVGYSKLESRGHLIPNDLRLKFEKETVHPQIYQNIVVDGTIPFQTTQELLMDLKRRMIEAGLPPETVRRWKPSYLILREVLPRSLRHLIYDYDVMRLLEERYMVMVVETSRGWELRDFEFRRR